MCSISRISPSWARAGCKKTLYLLRYPCKVYSFIHSLLSDTATTSIRWIFILFLYSICVFLKQAVGPSLRKRWLWGLNSGNNLRTRCAPESEAGLEESVPKLSWKNWNTSNPAWTQPHSSSFIGAGCMGRWATTSPLLCFNLPVSPSIHSPSFPNPTFSRRLHFSLHCCFFSSPLFPLSFFSDSNPPPPPPPPPPAFSLTSLLHFF